MSCPVPTPSGWLEISLQAAPTLHEILSSFLFDLGCAGVVTEDFEDRTLRGYLPAPEDPEQLRNRITLYLDDLAEIFPNTPLPVVQLTPVDEEDWDLAWRRFFRPARVTPDLLILPAWEPVPETIPPHVIRMDPGPAFGTGQHPTTRMCLEAMERVPCQTPWTLLDVGTGSGILAIYGARLGAAHVLAIDTDPEALRWAGQNIRLNRAEEVIRLSREPVEKVRETFFIVCANLILGEILRLMPVFPGLMGPGAWLILSGILGEQVQRVAASLSHHGLEIHETLHQEEWACVVAANCGTRNAKPATLHVKAR